MNRFWDPENNYQAGMLKEYRHWSLDVSYHQHTFGNFIVFCKREDVEKISELTNEEMLELKTVLHEIESALLNNPMFKPDRFNYWQMGNLVHHLHIHGIPRFKTERSFLGRVWKDEDSTKPVVWTYENQTHETVEKLKIEMKKFLR